MCRGDDASRPDFEAHFREFKGELNAERRSFLKSFTRLDRPPEAYPAKLKVRSETSQLEFAYA